VFPTLLLALVAALLLALLWFWRGCLALRSVVALRLGYLLLMLSRRLLELLRRTLSSRLLRGFALRSVVLDLRRRWLLFVLDRPLLRLRVRDRGRALLD